MLRRSRCQLNIDFNTLMMVDSLEMQTKEIKHVIEACNNCKSDKIVITRGTDRMVETAKAIAEADLESKTIVLTGAMIPYAFGSSSDGFFNLGCTLAYVQTLKPNVYITMQGQYFLCSEVKKTKNSGFLNKFEFINPLLNE